jgi:hypothetical protein
VSEISNREQLERRREEQKSRRADEAVGIKGSSTHGLMD